MRSAMSGRLLDVPFIMQTFIIILVLLMITRIGRFLLLVGMTSFMWWLHLQ